MKAGLFVVVGAVLFAVYNNLLESRLSYVSSVYVIFTAYVFAGILLAGPMILLGNRWGQVLVPPARTDLLLLGACALCLFLGDFLYVKAYNAGGDMVMITVVVSLMPLFSVALKWMATGTAPTTYQVLACALAAGAVYFASR